MQESTTTIAVSKEVANDLKVLTAMLKKPTINATVSWLMNDSPKAFDILTRTGGITEDV